MAFELGAALQVLLITLKGQDGRAQPCAAAKGQKLSSANRHNIIPTH